MSNQNFFERHHLKLIVLILFMIIFSYQIFKEENLSNDELRNQAADIYGQCIEKNIKIGMAAANEIQAVCRLEWRRFVMKHLKN